LTKLRRHEITRLPGIRALILRHGCTEAQGYLFSKPLAGDSVGAWLESFRSRSAAQPRRRAS